MALPTSAQDFKKGDAATESRERETKFSKGFNAYRKGDYATALKVFRPLAENGHFSAQLLLGVMYRAGEGVPRDYVEALKWYRKAAENGNDLSMMALGQMYYKNEGVPQDYVLAHMWYSLAVAGGDFILTAMRNMVAQKMTPAQIAEARKLAREGRAKHMKK